MKLDEEIKRVRKRTEEVEKSQRAPNGCKSFGMPVSKLVGYMRDRERAKEDGDTETIERIDKKCPALAAMDAKPTPTDEESNKKIEALESHFKKHPL